MTDNANGTQTFYRHPLTRVRASFREVMENPGQTNPVLSFLNVMKELEDINYDITHNQGQFCYITPNEMEEAYLGKGEYHDWFETKGSNLVRFAVLYNDPDNRRVDETDDETDDEGVETDEE